MLDRMRDWFAEFDYRLGGWPWAVIVIAFWLIAAWIIPAVIVLLPDWAVLLLIRAVQVALFCAVCWAGWWLIGQAD